MALLFSAQSQRKYYQSAVSVMLVPKARKYPIGPVLAGQKVAIAAQPGIK
jgi:hypothetical protein